MSCFFLDWFFCLSLRIGAGKLGKGLCPNEYNAAEFDVVIRTARQDDLRSACGLSCPELDVEVCPGLGLVVSG